MVRRGYSLVEVLVAMSILAIISTAVASAVVVASRALPDPESPIEALPDQATAFERLTGELAEATTLIEHAPSAVSVLVPDRDGDGADELIRWSWSGTVGDPAQRAYNGAAGSDALGSVHDFTFGYETATTPETYPGPLSESAEQGFVNYTNTGYKAADTTIDKTHYLSQWIEPSFPPGATAWTITRVEAVCSTEGNNDGQVRLEIRNGASDGVPTATVLQSMYENETSLSTGLASHSFDFAAPVSLSPGGVCVVFGCSAAAPGHGGRFQFQQSVNQGLAYTGDAGSSWKTDWSPGSLDIIVYGTVTASGPDQSFTRSFVERITIDSQVGDDTRSRARTAAEPINHPEALSFYALADFSSDPTATDLDADGTPDWQRSDGGTFDTGTLSGGRWNSDCLIETSSKDSFSSATLLTARWRTTSLYGTGSSIAINADWDASHHAAIEVSLVNIGTQQLLQLSHWTSSSTKEVLATVTDLPTTDVEVELLIDPAYSTAHLVVNGSEIGTYTYVRIPSADDKRRVFAGSEFGTAEFDSVEVRVPEVGP